MAKEYLLSSVHVHTKLCDGKNTPEELALSAWKAGLKTLGFSGHSHTPHDIEYCMTNARTQLYRAQVAKLKERYAGKLDILCGLEWDLYSDDDPAAYDYWIGSAHYVKGPKTGKYYEIDWREADLAACRRRHPDHVLHRRDADFCRCDEDAAEHTEERTKE